MHHSFPATKAGLVPVDLSPWFSMDPPNAWSQECICGRVFTTPQGISAHHNSCPKTKKRLASVLDKAKEVQAAKKHHTAEAKLVSPETAAPRLVPGELPLNDLPLPGSYSQV